MEKARTRGKHMDQQDFQPSTAAAANNANKHCTRYPQSCPFSIIHHHHTQPGNNPIHSIHPRANARGKGKVSSLSLSLSLSLPTLFCTWNTGVCTHRRPRRNSCSRVAPTERGLVYRWLLLMQYCERTIPGIRRFTVSLISNWYSFKGLLGQGAFLYPVSFKRACNVAWIQWKGCTVKSVSLYSWEFQSSFLSTIIEAGSCCDKTARMLEWSNESSVLLEHGALIGFYFLGRVRNVPMCAH